MMDLQTRPPEPAVRAPAPAAPRAGEPPLWLVLAYWAGLASRRRRLLAAVLAAAVVLAVGLHVMLPRTYTARTTILPPERERGSDLLLGQLRSIAGLGGRGGSVPLVPEVVRSRTVQTAALARQKDGVPWSAILRPDAPQGERARWRLLQEIGARISTELDAGTGFLSIGFRWTDREQAAGFLTALVAELEAVMREATQAEADRRLQLLNGRLDEVAGELAAAEDALADFRTRNRAIASPNLMREEGRLAREVEIAGLTYAELKKELELARIDQGARDRALLILDPPAAPPRPDGRLARFLAAALLLGGAVGLGWGRWLDVRRGT